MAKCTPSIRIDGPHHLRLGDRVRGVVVVDVDEDVRTNKVDVELVWRTHGRGDVDKGVVASKQHPAAQWQAGRTVQMPFDFELPKDGPITTRGTLVNLDWYVTARVDLPWAIDAKTEVDIIVDADGAAPIFNEADAYPGAVNVRNMAMGAQLGCVVGISLFVVPFFLGAAAFAVPSVIRLVSGEGLLPVLPMLFGGLVFAAIPCFILYKVWHTYLGHRFLAGAKVVLEPSIADAGEGVRVRFEVPKNPQSIEAVSAKLIGRERARYRSGTDTRTATHELHNSEITMQRQGQSWAGRAAIPSHATTSLATRNNHVEWHVELKASVKGAPDPSFSELLPVRGRGRRESP